ncbi:MAG: EamA family transporter [Patescibacteria group bacterium]
MSYIIYAWIASITYGLGSIIGKLATKYHIDNPYLYNVIWSVLTLIFIIPFALIGHVGFPQDWNSIIWLGLSSAVSSITFTLAFYAVDLSILSPLANMRAPFTALLGVMLFHESLSSFQWGLIFLLFFAGLFIHADEHFSLKSFLSKATLLAFIWILTSVWFNTMIKTASIHNGYWEVSLWSSVLTVIFLIPTLPLFINSIKKTPFKNYLGIALNTALYTVGLLFSIKALAVNVSISMAIISVPLTLILTMILSFIAPKLLEKHSLKIYVIRLAAASVMFFAALGLSK